MMKNRYIIGITLLMALCAVPAVAGDTPLDGQAIYDAVDKVLVTVRYKAEMTFMGETQDIEGRVIGISVGPDGLVIFDGATLGAGAGFAADFGGSPRVDKPTLLTVTDRAGKTYPVDYVGVDQFSSIAFCRLPDSARSVIPTATFEPENLSLGDKVNVFWMLPENYQPRFQMSEAAITAILTQPEKYFLTGELSPAFIMAPVITKDGKLLGVITQVSTTGEEYAPYEDGPMTGSPVGIMPLDQFKKLLANPPVPGEVRQGWLGIVMQALDPDIASVWHIDVPGGVIVSDVVSRSPADRAGLKQGDFIVAVDGKPLQIKKESSLAIIQKMISERGAGASLNMTIIRPEEQKVETLAVVPVLEQAPTAAIDAPNIEDKNFDFTLRDMVFSDYNIRNLDPDKIKGVIVDKLEAGGWAAVGGMYPGDIVVKIGEEMVTSVAQAKEALAKLETARTKEVVFMVWRRNKTQFVNVKTHWE